MKRSSSMEVAPYAAQPWLTPQPPPPPPLPPRKSYSFHFPTATDSAVGEEILEIGHHPNHPIVRCNLSDRFTCAGCKEYGAGLRFACKECDFQLHDFCAFSSSILKNHPIHPYHQQLLFHAKPKQGNLLWPKCDVCGKATKGFMFKCTACSFQMHPCCAMLSPEMNFEIHPHNLKLLPAAPASDEDPDFVCAVCRRKRSGRWFGCTTCTNYHLHAVCAKNMINGLQSNGIYITDKPSKLGSAVRVVSIVAVKFLGGLMEGIGESVGGAIVQGISRGRGTARARGLGGRTS
ncbi:hypothetical protein NMG60_11024586 [Bertholletia excelsa]